MFRYIHCCETTPGANLNVMVATTVPSFPGFPLGVTAGTYHQTFNLLVNGTYNPAFILSAFAANTVPGAEAALTTGIINACEAEVGAVKPLKVIRTSSVCSA